MRPEIYISNYSRSPSERIHPSKSGGFLVFSIAFSRYLLPENMPTKNTLNFRPLINVTVSRNGGGHEFDQARTKKRTSRSDSTG